MKEYRLYAGAYTDGRPGNGVFFLRFGADGLRAESKRGSGGRVAKFRGIL